MSSKHISETLVLPKKRSCDTCDNRHCIVSRFCSEDWRTFLSKHKTTYRIPAGEEIFSKGNLVEGIYCVYSGYIKVFEFDGRSERIVDLIKGGEILGYRGLSSKLNNYTVSAKALSESEITFFPMDIFRLAIEANKQLAFFLIDILSSKINNIEYRSNNCTNIQAIDKIRWAIADMITSFGFKNNDKNNLKFTLSRKDIASLAGTTYETVIRSLGELDKQNQIKLEGKSIRILNLEHFIDYI
jgi:CRP-like cAMP-binding protein